MTIPAHHVIPGIVKIKDAPAFYEALLGRIRPPWYRRVWDWIRGRRRNGPYTHTFRPPYRKGEMR